MSEVLYLEYDEEITSAIDKLLHLNAQTVSIVVPKRSTLLQSVVNLKLLKKAAADNGKELVLVTADRTATHLAGMVGLAVASTLKAKPSIPTIADAKPETSEIIEEEAQAEVPAPAAADAVKKARPSFAKPVLVQRSVDSEPAAAAVSAAGSRPKVPDFNALQRRLLWGGGLGLLVLSLVLANFFLKRATVTLYAKGTEVQAEFSFTVDPAAQASNPDQSLLTGQLLESSKDLSTTFPATGKKDIGAKAGGTITVTNYCYNPGTLPAGTVFTAVSGQKFLSTVEAVVPDAQIKSGNCNATTTSVAVQASQNGDQYNLAPTSYSVGAVSASSLRGQGNQMSGGLSKQISVVTAVDVAKAKTELLAKSKEPSQKELETKAPSGYQAIAESFEQVAGAVTSDPAVDSEASQATLTIAVTNRQLAVRKDEYKELIKAQELKLVGAANQIYDDGSSEAKITAGKKEASGRQEFGFSAEAYSGAKIDTAAVAKQVSGKRYGDAINIATELPGVDRAEISGWPSWSSKLPRLSNRIKVEIKVAGKGS